MELNFSEKNLIVVGLKQELNSCQKEIDACKELDVSGKWTSYIEYKQNQIEEIKELIKRFE